MKECMIDDTQIAAIYRQIGANVKKARALKGVSQLSLSLAIGHKAVGTVSMAEIGLNKKHFNLEHLIKIADVLEIEVCTLLEDLLI